MGAWGEEERRVMPWTATWLFQNVVIGGILGVEGALQARAVTSFYPRNSGRAQVGAGKVPQTAT
jgi:hypothetical protein